MVVSTQSWSSKLSRCVHAVGLGLAMMLATSHDATAAEDADSQSTILRFDPVNHTFNPIALGELKAGCIYSHFDKNLNRRVWSFWQSDARFWHALGEGTTQPGRCFDVRETLETRREVLEKVDREFAQKLERSGGLAYLRLNAENQWELDRVATTPTIYNAETGERWDWANGRYVSVVSSSGYRWVVEDKRYRAAEDPGDEMGCLRAPCMGWALEARPCGCR